MTTDIAGSAANLGALRYLLRPWQDMPADQDSARLADAYDAVLSLLARRADTQEEWAA